MTIEPKWDDIDNRNMQTLRQTVSDSGACSCDKPDAWPEGLRNIVLWAMRKAGDEALLDQVSVRLERAVFSTKDVRAGATLSIPEQNS
jgi:hypothetical protein